MQDHTALAANCPDCPTSGAVSQRPTTAVVAMLGRLPADRSAKTSAGPVVFTYAPDGTRLKKTSAARVTLYLGPESIGCLAMFHRKFGYPQLFPRQRVEANCKAGHAVGLQNSNKEGGNGLHERRTHPNYGGALLFASGRLCSSRDASLIDLARAEAERLCEAEPLEQAGPESDSVTHEAELQAA